MAEALRVWIEREDCISCGHCWTVCPDFFEQNADDLHSQVIVTYRSSGNIGEGQAPSTLERCVKDAEDGCPVQIIHVE